MNPNFINFSCITLRLSCWFTHININYKRLTDQSVLGAVIYLSMIFLREKLGRLYPSPFSGIEHAGRGFWRIVSTPALHAIALDPQRTPPHNNDHTPSFPFTPVPTQPPIPSLNPNLGELVDTLTEQVRNLTATVTWSCFTPIATGYFTPFPRCLNAGCLQKSAIVVVFSFRCLYLYLYLYL